MSAAVNALVLIIVSYLAVGVQVGAGAHLRLGAAAPNIGLALAAYLALRAAPRTALLACIGLGLMQDLATQQPFGVFALTYGLTALMGQRLTHVLQRYHPLTMMILVGAGGIVWMMIVCLHDLHRPLDGGTAGPPIRTPLRLLATATLWSVCLAPLLAWVLDRLLRQIGWRPAESPWRYAITRKSAWHV
jgi:cell shape-determining protein MreD